jgi:hypothetical protein
MKVNKKGWVFAQVPIWATCDPTVSDGAHRLLTYLAWRQGNDASCWPSIARMARDLDSSPKTIQRRLRELEEVGYLETTHRKGRSSQYTLVADPDRACETYTPVNVGRGPRSGATPAPVSSVGGPRSDTTPTPVTSVGGPRSELTGTPVNPDPHDDKTEQEENGREKRDETRLPLWSAVLNDLRLQMTRATFEAWLATATARREGDALVIQLATRQAKAWVSRRLHGLVCRTVRRVFDDGDLAITYEVRGRA